MQAKSIKGKTTEEIKAALAESKADGFTPTLAIVFISISQDRNTVCKILDDAGIQIFGATTNGEFIDENPEKLSVAILLLDMNPAYFSVLFFFINRKNHGAAVAFLSISENKLIGKSIVVAGHPTKSVYIFTNFIFKTK